MGILIFHFRASNVHSKLAPAASCFGLGTHIVGCVCIQLLWARANHSTAGKGDGRERDRYEKKNSVRVRPSASALPPRRTLERGARALRFPRLRLTNGGWLRILGRKREDIRISQI